MQLALWRLIGRLEVDDAGLLRYSVSFGNQKVAQSVVDWAGSCRRYRGQVKWVGRNAWYGLSLMGAPDEVVRCARECGGKPADSRLEELIELHICVGVE